jgi:hypothetical protein
MDLKYILNIFIVSFLILSIILFIKSIGFTFNEPEHTKKLIQTINLEGLTTNSSQSFCDVNKGFELEKACNKLTKDNCGIVSCCVFTGDNKCKAGNIKGPTFNSDENGKTNSLSHYYFQNKCYGDGC